MTTPEAGRMAQRLCEAFYEQSVDWPHMTNRAKARWLAVADIALTPQAETIRRLDGELHTRAEQIAARYHDRHCVYRQRAETAYRAGQLAMRERAAKLSQDGRGYEDGPEHWESRAAECSGECGEDIARAIRALEPEEPK